MLIQIYQFLYKPGIRYGSHCNKDTIHIQLILFCGLCLFQSYPLHLLLSANFFHRGIPDTGNIVEIFQRIL